MPATEEAQKETPVEKLERRRAETTGRAPSGKATAKRPQDHKPKAQKPDTDGYVSVEYEGEKIRVEGGLDPAGDFELMDAIGQVEKGTMYGLGDLIRSITHPEDYPSLLDACRSARGKVDTQTLAGFIPVALEAGGLGNS